jgi:hypothetical protein
MSAKDLDARRRCLDEFVVDNDDLEKLSAKLAEFNVFNVLRIESAEIRHSNVLAWLLTPTGTHGLGDLFLRRFISTLLMENEVPATSLTPARAQLMPLDDVEVYREWQNIDIFVTSRSGKWCLLVENKIRSRESSGQLRRYVQAVRGEYSDREVIPVYLSLAGEDPSEDGQDLGFVALSYERVLPIVTKVAQQYRARMPEEAKMFVRQYCETLGRLTMQDEELVSLCKQIYRKHRDAIEMIVQVGSSSEVLDACKQAVEGIDDLETVVGPYGSRIWFIPREMAAVQREVGSGWNFLPKAYPVMFWVLFRKREGKIQLCLEVGPVDEPKTRVAILDAFRNKGFTFRDSAYRDEAKYTRVYSKTRAVGRTEDDEYDLSTENVAKIVTSLWKQASDTRANALEALDSVIWPATSA